MLWPGSLVRLGRGGIRFPRLIPGTPVNIPVRHVVQQAGQNVVLTRTMRVLLPVGLPTSNRPTVMMLHGGEGGTAATALGLINAGTTAPAQGVMVFAPDAQRDQWADGRLTSAGPVDAPHDDVGFILACWQIMVERYGMDPLQCHAAGFSSGGMMIMRLALEVPQYFASFFAVCANMPRPLGGYPQSAIFKSIAILHRSGDPLYEPEPGDLTSQVLPRLETLAELRVDQGACSAFSAATGGIRLAGGCRQGRRVKDHLLAGGHQWNGTGNDGTQLMYGWMHSEGLPDASAPVITGPTAVSVAEGATAVGSYSANEAVTWSLAGNDAALFGMNGVTGTAMTLAFVAAPNFEAPGDLGDNNVYDVQVVATNAADLARVRPVVVTVTDVAEGPPYDYLVATNAEWDAVLANSDATLSGKRIAVSGAAITRRSIANRTFSPDLRIGSLNAGSSLPGLDLRAVGGLDLNGLNLQYPTWPASGAIIAFLNGAMSGFKMRGCTARHGYGPGHLDFDPLADLPEYARIDNVTTATTTSSRIALAYQDAAGPSAWVEFFNRGAVPVYYRLGDATVVATASDTLVAPGARVRSASKTAPLHTHVAVLAASGTSEVNARTEIGLSSYLANLFSAEGGVTHAGFEFTGNLVTDVGSACKGMGTIIGSPVIMDNTSRRIYMDVRALTAVEREPGDYAYVLRNQDETPFARSGIAEGLGGDARDPHGDKTLQTFSATPTRLNNVIVAGNRHLPAPRRAGVVAQDVFIGDSDEVYLDLFVIANVLAGGAQHAVAIGEGGDVRHAYVEGNTAINLADPTQGASIGLTVAAGYDSWVGHNVARVLPAPTADLMVADNAVPSATVTDTFPAWADRLTATTAAQLEAALATAGPAAGKGVAALRASYIDDATADPTQVVRWANLPPGIRWDAVQGAAAGAVTTFPLRKVKGGPASSAVAPGTGVEWRACSDRLGASVVTDWTSAPGSVARGHFVQMRRTASATPGASLDADLTINGVLHRAALVTAMPSFLLGTAWFLDPGNVPGATGAIEWEFRGRIPAPAAGGAKYVGAQMSPMGLYVGATGGFSPSVKSAANANLALTHVSGPVAPLCPADVLTTIRYKVDYNAALATLSVDGVETVWSFAAGSGPAMTAANRRLVLAASSGGATPLPADTVVEHLRLYLTTSGVRSLRKEISLAAQGSLAAINADAWHQGGSVS